VVYRGTHVTVEFDLDRKGIAELAMGPKMRQGILDFAEGPLKSYAIGISPRSSKEHQHYADSFVVVPGAKVIRRLRRVAALLINTAPHAAAVEWGNEQTPRGHRVLGETLAHFMGPNPHSDGL
jgi:hypothetical protein